MRRALKKVKLPTWVQSVTIEPMVDHTGDPAARVVVLVRAGREGVIQDGGALLDLTGAIHVALNAEGLDLFPYTRFFVASEAA